MTTLIISRRHLVLSLLLAAFFMFLNGCSMARTIGMSQVGKENSPVPPNGKGQSVEVRGDLISGPMVVTVFVSETPVAEIASFYRQELAKRGWEESKWGAWGHDELPNTEFPYRNYQFTRSGRLGRGTGAWNYAYERLSLEVDISADNKRPIGSAQVKIIVEGSYAWDAPSEFALQMIGRVMGNASEGIWVLWLF